MRILYYIFTLYFEIVHSISRIGISYWGGIQNFLLSFSFFTFCLPFFDTRAQYHITRRKEWIEYSSLSLLLRPPSPPPPPPPLLLLLEITIISFNDLVFTTNNINDNNNNSE